LLNYYQHCICSTTPSPSIVVAATATTAIEKHPKY